MSFLLGPLSHSKLHCNLPHGPWLSDPFNRLSMTLHCYKSIQLRGVSPTVSGGSLWSHPALHLEVLSQFLNPVKHKEVSPFMHHCTQPSTTLWGLSLSFYVLDFLWVCDQSACLQFTPPSTDPELSHLPKATRS